MNNSNRTHSVISWGPGTLKIMTKKILRENNKQVPISFKDERLKNRCEIMLISASCCNYICTEIREKILDNICGQTNNNLTQGPLGLNS